VTGNFLKLKPGGAKLAVSTNIKKVMISIRRQPLILFFFTSHTLFALFLGRLYALAPDEGGYVYTFNNLYGSSMDPNPQYNSGWITAPKIFLWMTYLPGKILNWVGTPDYLSIRIISIALTTLSLYLLKNIIDGMHMDGKSRHKIIFVVFFIPSVFLWTSVGLREAFIIAEIAAFLTGFNFLIQGMNKRAIILLTIGSYGLVSTKSYLWACLMLALIISGVIFFYKGMNRRKIVTIFVAGLFLPVILFASTTSVYALEFILRSDISAAGERSGDSISQIYVDTPSTGTGTDDGTGTGTDDGTGTGTDSPNKPTQALITFHGDYTLIALHFYLIDNPNSPFSRILGVLNLDDKIQQLWDEKIQVGLISKDNQVGSDTSSLNGHILEPANIREPVSFLWPTFVFLFGPFPFIGDPGIAVGISSLESPLWWAFYALVIFQFIRFRKIKFMQDPQIIFTLIFLAGEIAFSALVEVNLGTSFRHRSILLVPLVFLYVRLVQRAKEQKDLELGVI
jgi:hypothetical protein